MKKIITLIFVCVSISGAAQTISRIEYFIDVDPGFGLGSVVSVTPGSNITRSFNIDLSSVSVGLHMLHVRAKGSNGYWSLTNTVPFYAASAPSNSIAQIEYFIDADPGFGSATQVSFTASSNVVTPLSINVAGISTGLHCLNVRAKDSDGFWGVTTSMPLYITSGATADISRIEYFIDVDPGFGSGTAVSFTPSPNVITSLNIDVSVVSPGLHTLNVRSMDEFGSWSIATTVPIYVISGAIANVNRIEYFIDNDPGFGLATPVSLTPGSNINQNFIVNTGDITAGLHTLHVRVKDENGIWSPVSSSPFAVGSSGASAVVGFEYAVDADPGFGNGTLVAPSIPSSDISEILNLNLGALSDGTHNLFIRPRDASGVWGPTEILAFEFCSLNAPVANEATNVGTKSFGASWSTVGGATSYKLDVSSDNFSTFVTGYNNRDVSTPALVVASLATNTSYKYRVRSFGTCTSENSNEIFVTTFQSTQASDSLALVALYNATDGLNWLNKANWLTAPVVTWDGISINAQRVTGIDLSLNNLKGSVPSQIINLTNLASFNLSNNSLTDFPNVSTIASLTSLSLQNNQLTFEDLEPNISVAGFNYSPQGAFGSGDTLVITVDESLDYSFTTGGTANMYQWILDGDPVDAETSNTISRVMTLADDGVWNLQVTNSIVPGLTLMSNDVRVIVQLPGILTDSISLVALYNTTNGPGWTNRSNWLTGLVKDWHGVGVTNNKVISLNLSSNNLIGEVPAEVTQMLNVTTINLSTNKLTDLPDMSSMPSLSTLNVSQNSLQFGSLELNVSVDNFNYSNQAAIGNAQNSELYALSPFELEALVSGVNNSYIWKRNGIAIPGATAPQLSIGEITRAQEGTYVCDVTNSNVPGLTIKTAPHELLPVADLSGQLLINNDELVSAGTVTLLEVQEENGYDTIHVVDVSSAGEYLFEKVKLRDYMIVGFPDTTSYSGALPTYYQNTLFWEEADEIAVDASMEDLDIQVQSKPEDVPVGEGVLRGVLWEDDGTGRKKAPKRVSGAGVTARRVEGSGRGKETLQLVDYQFTDERGEFEIKGLTEDDFRLNILYPGYPMDLTSDVVITIGSDYKAEKEVEATVEDGKIVVREILITGIEKDQAINVFPNPATTDLSIQFARIASRRYVTLFDAMGKKIATYHAPSRTEVINIDDLPGGVYFIRITSENKLVASSQLVVR